MAYFNEKFKRARLDQSPYLFHFPDFVIASPKKYKSFIFSRQ